MHCAMNLFMEQDVCLCHLTGVQMQSYLSLLQLQINVSDNRGGNQE